MRGATMAARTMPSGKRMPRASANGQFDGWPDGRLHRRPTGRLTGWLNGWRQLTMAAVLVMAACGMMALQAGSVIIPVHSTQTTAMQSIATTWPSATVSWVAGENCSTWGGVVCDDDGYVTQLDLSGLDLEGTIPSDAISTLVTLQELKLHDNSIEDDLPVKFSALTALSFLSLGRNDIAGFIPPGYSALSKLNYLLLSDNRITDQVPSDLSTLTDLEALDLSKNRLSGSIPAEVVALPNLIYFDISNNELSGPAPTGFASTSFQATAEATYNIERNYFNGSANANITAGNGTISFCPNKLQGGFAQAALLPYSPSLYGSVRGNCMVTSTKGACTSDKQRKTNDCLAFCGAGMAGGPCGGHGRCYLSGPSRIPTCECEKDYFVYFAIQSGIRYPSCSNSTMANPPPSPPPPPPEDPDRRKPGLKDTDYQAVPTKPLTNFNKYFRHVSMGYTGTATKPSWTYKTAVDWRMQVVNKQNRTVVGPTVDQGTCAACWALLPVAAIESAYAIAYGSNQPNISGQHILNCQGTWECVGGIPSDAFQFAASGGVLSDYMVPYTGVKDATNCGPAARRRLAASFPPDLWFDRALEDHRASTQGSSLQQQSPSGGLASSARRHASNFAPSPPALLAPPASPADSFTPPHPPPPPYTAPSRLSELSFKGHPPESPLHSPPPLPPPPPSVFSNLLSSLFQIPRARILQSSSLSSSSSSSSFSSSLLPSSASSFRSFSSSSRPSSMGKIKPLKKKTKKKPPPAPAAEPLPGPYTIAMFEQVSVSGWLGMVLALQAQPIIANVEADQTSFMDYAGGYIYADPDCFINGVVNHIVLLVGYSMVGATPYFILQNSWGSTWGQNGFMQMAIQSGDGICGVNTSPALYPVVRGPNPCVPNPCGGGTCSPGRGPGGYTCKCKTYFVVGKNVDQSPVCIPLKPCSLNAVNPCQVGTCLDDSKGSYNCICPPGFFFDKRPDNTPSCILGPTPDEIRVFPGLTCNLVMSTYGISLANFTLLNHDLNCARLRLGDDIHIGDTNPCATPYTITYSETCAAVAAEFNITVEQLKAENHELKCNKPLQIGQQVCIERGTADLPMCQEYVTVAEGDTCDTIMRSARPPLTSQEFYALNPGINCNVGEQTLLGQQICTRGGQSSVLLGASRCVTKQTYTVVTGDTCARILALYFKSSARLLAQYNSGYVCTNSRLYKGTVLCKAP